MRGPQAPSRVPRSFKAPFDALTMDGLEREAECGLQVSHIGTER